MAIALLITLLYAALCLIFGAVLFRLLQRWGSFDIGVPVYALSASHFLLGQGVFANIWLLLGLCGFMKRSVIWSILLLIILLGVILVYRGLRTQFGKWMESLGVLLNLPWQWLGLVFLVFSLLILHGMKAVILPPSGDAEAFYMVLPKIVAASERLVPQPNYYFFSQIGLIGEMHYAALISISGPPAAKLFTWVTGLSMAALILALCAECGFSIRGKIVSLVMLVTSSTFYFYLSDGKVDLYGAAFGLAAYYWALKTKAGLDIIPAILTGFFAGFAMVAKFSNIPVILPGVLTLLAWNFSVDERGRFSLAQRGYLIRLSCLVFLSIICAWLPHIAKNFVLFNEPLAPFVFLNSAGNKWVDQAWFSPENTRYIILTYPLALVYGQYPMQGGNISPLVMALAPMVLFLERKGPLLRSALFKLTTVAASGVFIWMICRPSVLAPRYILATLLLFIPIFAASGERALSTGRRTLSAAIYSALFIVLLICINAERGVSPIFMRGLSTELSPCEQAGANCYGLTYLNSLVTPGERVYSASYYTYFLSPEILQCLQRQPDEEKFLSWEKLYLQGFTWLFLQKDSHAGMLEKLNERKLPEWLAVTPLLDDDTTAIYRIASTDPKRNPEYGCRMINPLAWQVVKLK